MFPSTSATPRSPSRIRDQLRDAQAAIGTKVTPHDFRRTVATQVANSTTIANATALLGHADEGTTVRHYVKRTHVAPDLRTVIDQLVTQAATLGIRKGKRSEKGVRGTTKGPTSA
ncbi:hypothetical protein GCM10009809_25840 [Isoptericola hypogeus]|uniref:Tyr recombinase domain-containing protein n=1 Tax=Isoptericola hypogeus TaxID=300179 RepID=A0ABP4VJK6_9MICO